TEHRSSPSLRQNQLTPSRGARTLCAGIPCGWFVITEIATGGQDEAENATAWRAARLGRDQGDAGGVVLRRPVRRLHRGELAAARSERQHLEPRTRRRLIAILQLRLQRAVQRRRAADAQRAERAVAGDVTLQRAGARLRERTDHHRNARFYFQHAIVG